MSKIWTLDAAQHNAGLGLSKKDRQAVQRLTGATVDGDLGPATAQAVARWQARNGLDVTGRLCAHTLAGLGIGQPKKRRSKKSKKKASK